MPFVHLRATGTLTDALSSKDERSRSCIGRTEQVGDILPTHRHSITIAMMKIERPPEPQIPARLPPEPKAPSTPLAAAARLRSLRQLGAFLSWRIYPANSSRIDTSAACFDDPTHELLAHGHIVDDTAIITFRGTIGPFFVSTNWKNVNLRIKQIENPPRHEGFHEGWMALRPTIDSWLKGTPFKALILTVHSLGAALAQLAAHDFAAVFAIERLILFAPPMVGGRAFNDGYSRTIVQANGDRLESITEKYLLLSDVIGAPLPGYEHAEPLFPIDRKGRIMRAGKIPDHCRSVLPEMK
jgi:Lipase (class 3)